LTGVCGLTPDLPYLANFYAALLGAPVGGNLMNVYADLTPK
jgi:hypothetical protein